MNHGSVVFCIFVGFLMVICGRADADVSFSNDWQEVEVFLHGDEEEIDQDYAGDNGGWDSDLDIWVDDPALEGYAQGQLETFYESDKVVVDGRINLRAMLPSASPYTEISARAHVYYQTSVMVTDEPAWLKITGYLTPDQDHETNDHFWIGSPVWYWWADYYSGDKVWMIDTTLFDVGYHNLYGGVDYTLVATTDEPDELYADYYFSVEVIPPPVFEPSDADLDGSGRVNLVDLSLFASAWLWEEGT